ncbi:uncharacterized protein LOC135462215 [Liolophura sinensis]|uniref:uncharacterized protein LOC135462215 n=1 Tax=Liolophura sinensis TaxID=3198878 RepID=UPI003159721A
MSLTTDKGMTESMIRRRLEKLVRTCDSLTMKIFITIECFGEDMVNAHYSADRKALWEEFLDRKEACRLDINGHDKLKEKYDNFFKLPIDDAGKAIHEAICTLLHSKGAADCFRQISPNNAAEHTKGPSRTFSKHLARMFEKKLDTWFSSFDAVAVKLSGHVKVSGFVRVLSGQLDMLATRNGFTYIVDIKSTSLDSPKPMDVVHLCLLKMLAIQNGLEDPNNVRLALLILHLHPARPVLRLWEYDPTVSMERALREGDIDKLIEAGRKSEHHELWKCNAVIVAPKHMVNNLIKTG